MQQGCILMSNTIAFSKKKNDEKDFTVRARPTSFTNTTISWTSVETTSKKKNSSTRGKTL